MAKERDSLGVINETTWDEICERTFNTCIDDLHNRYAESYDSNNPYDVPEDHITPTTWQECRENLERAVGAFAVIDDRSPNCGVDIDALSRDPQARAVWEASGRDIDNEKSYSKDADVFAHSAAFAEITPRLLNICEELNGLYMAEQQGLIESDSRRFNSDILLSSANYYQAIPYDELNMDQKQMVDSEDFSQRFEAAQKGYGLDKLLVNADGEFSHSKAFDYELSSDELVGLGFFEVVGRENLAEPFPDRTDIKQEQSQQAQTQPSQAKEPHTIANVGAKARARAAAQDTNKQPSQMQKQEGPKR